MVNWNRFKVLDEVILANTYVVIVTFDIQSNVLKLSLITGSTLEFLSIRVVTASENSVVQAQENVVHMHTTRIHTTPPSLPSYM